MKKIIALLLVLVLLFSMTACGSEGGKDSASNTVVVYSPHDADPLNDAINMFMKEYPEIQVEVVAAGTGELLARVKAESTNPIADVIWGGGADSLAAYKEYFQPFESSEDEYILDQYKDPDDLWIGESPLPMVLFYNKALIEKAGMEIPTSWEDLTDPAWFGKIAFCAPSKSGSAYTQLCTMLTGHGGSVDGWDFIEKLYTNLDGRILDSSSNCHKMVADGEFYVGLTLEKAVVQYDDPDLGFCYPTDGTSAVPDGVALIKNCPNQENAELFINYVLGYDCQVAQSTKWGRRPVRTDVAVAGGMAALSDITLVDYDFDWAASDKEAIQEQFNDMMVELG